MPKIKLSLPIRSGRTGNKKKRTRFEFYLKMLKKKIKKNKGILISVGAGINQVPLIAEAKKLGFSVIGIDNDTVAAGFPICDLRIQESISSPHQIYTILQELFLEGTVSCIMSKSYGTAVKTACFLSEKYGIPMLPEKRMNDFINKKKMKDVFRQNKILSPKALLWNKKIIPKKIEALGYPLIIKPVIGHAKRGIKLVNDIESLKKELSKLSNPSSTLLEQYIKGDEIIAIGLVHRKKYFLVDITDKIKTKPPYFVDLMHISPSRHYNLKDSITVVGQEVANAFDIHSSPLIMEMIVDSKGNLQLIEAVPEFGGEYIPEIVVPARTGYNYIRETIKAVAGLKINRPSLKEKNAVVVKFIEGKRGTLANCKTKGLKVNRRILFSKIFIDVGAKTKKPKNNHDRLGVVITKARTIKDAVDLAEESAKKFELLIE